MQRKEGVLSYFPNIEYSSPEMVLPKISWDGKRSALIMSCHNMTGTSLSADQLFVFFFGDSHGIKYSSFGQPDLDQQIRKQISFQYDRKEKMVSICNLKGDIIGSENVSEIGDRAITGINVLNMVTFTPGKETIVRIQVGYEVTGWASPYYTDNSIVLSAPVNIHINAAAKEGQETVEFKVGNLSTDLKNHKKGR